jgi:hypothetical protein
MEILEGSNYLVIDFMNHEVWADWTEAMELLREELDSALEDCDFSGLTKKKQNELIKWLESISSAERKWNVIAPTLLREKATLVRFFASGGYTGYANSPE